MKKLLSCLVLTATTLVLGCSESADRGSGNVTAGGAVQSTEATKFQRFGSVIGLKHEKKDYYNRLHADPWPEINAMIKKCNIRNYSIYEVEIDSKLYLFSYFEYTGDDFKADMEKMAANEKTNQWWAETDPCQIRLPGTPDGEQWLKIEEVYHLD